MRIFAIADPHLSKRSHKPMDVFGGNWEGHPEIFFERWRETVDKDDVVLIPGDISWAMHLDAALDDLQDIAQLPGKKVLLRGNHDYWWPSISRLRSVLPEGMYAIQNDALALNSVVIAGTRGWVCPNSFDFTEQDEKIYQRELERLKLSLTAAQQLKGQLLIAMLHFPPTNPRLEPCGFTELLEAYAADIVVFGHIHGETNKAPLPKIGNSKVIFVAADALGFKPALIAEV
jgi:predicted phosphohydrolase